MSSSRRVGGLMAVVVLLAIAGTALILGAGGGQQRPLAPSPAPSSGGIAATPAGSAAMPSGDLGLPEFTACVPPNEFFKSGTTETEVISGPNGDVSVELTRGYTWRGEITATDPRLSGMHFYSWDGNGYTPGSANPAAPEVIGQATWAEGHRIENDGGAWSGSAHGLTLADGTERASPIVLTGEGAYDGLTAVMFFTEGDCFFDFRGIVADVPDPPVPFTGG